jgi:asparagine synthase (glutamine-hydrolysing)
MGDVKALSFTLFHQAPSQGYGRYAVERSQVVMRSPFLDNDVVQWLYRAPGPSATADARSAAIIERQRPDLLAIPTDQGQLGSGGRVVRSARHLYRRGLAKAEYLTNHGAPHWLAGATASGAGSLVERAFRGRNKFQHFHLWFRRELADVVRGTLLDAKQWNLQAWFDMPTVERMVEDHLHGRANYTEEIDRLLTVAVASRRLLTAGAVPARAALAIRS